MTTVEDATRKLEMLRTIDVLVSEHRKWRDAENWTPIPNVPGLEDAIEATITVVCSGSCPAECRELGSRAEEFKTEWQDYVSGRKVTKGDGTPHASLWKAYETLIYARRDAIDVARKMRESVTELKRQDVTGQNIAKIYGMSQVNPSTGNTEWTGIFFGPEGSVRHDLIDQQFESEKPGSDVESVFPADYVHPEDISRADTDRERIQKALDWIGNRGEDETETKKPFFGVSEVIAELRAGQLVSNIAKQAGMTVEGVEGLAKYQGIIPYDAGSDLTWEQQQNANAAEADQQLEQVDPIVEDNPVEAVVELSSMDDERAAEIIYELLDTGGMTDSQISEQIADQFQAKVTRQKVMAIRLARKPVEA